ncbi:MAG: cupin domain-containing protein [Candidatus Gracilibacteria bacterium]|nr:cupin domain-containing protein [Candidatus Gracilibacteria bacterium]
MLKIIREDKPWGIIEQITHEKKSTIQVLKIKKGEELSLHYHKIRNDYWYIISGEGIAIINDKSKNISSGDLIYLEKLTPHSVKALTDELIVMEICFDIFDSKDTYRISDKYGRN